MLGAGGARARHRCLRRGGHRACVPRRGDRRRPEHRPWSGEEVGRCGVDIHIHVHVHIHVHEAGLARRLEEGAQVADADGGVAAAGEQRRAAASFEGLVVGVGFGRGPQRHEGAQRLGEVAVRRVLGRLGDGGRVRAGRPARHQLDREGDAVQTLLHGHVSQRALERGPVGEDHPHRGALRRGQRGEPGVDLVRVAALLGVEVEARGAGPVRLPRPADDDMAGRREDAVRQDDPGKERGRRWFGHPTVASSHDCSLIEPLTWCGAFSSFATTLTRHRDVCLYGGLAVSRTIMASTASGRCPARLG